MGDLMAKQLDGRVLPPAPMPQLFSGGVVDKGYDHGDAVIEMLAAKNLPPENGRFLEAVVQAGLKRPRNPPPPMPKLFSGGAGTKRLPKRGRVVEAVLQPEPTMEDLMAEEGHGRWSNPPASKLQLFSGGGVDVGYDHAAAVIDMLAAKKPLPANGRFLEAVLQAGPAAMKELTAAEPGGHLFPPPLPRRRNPPPPMPQLFSGGAVTKRLPKRGRVMEAVFQPGPTMEDLMAEEHHGRVLPPPLPQWRNPPASKRQLFSGRGVDVGYDHAAAVIAMLAAKKPLPANGRFLEAVLQAGPAMKELKAAEPGDHLFPPPLPRRRNPPASMPHLFSGGGVDVGDDHATAVVNSLAGKNPLQEKGRFLETVGPTMKELTAAEHGRRLLPPPLLDWMNPPHLFSGNAVDVVDYDAAAAVLIDTLAAGETLPTMKDTTVAGNNSCLLPPPLPNWTSLPQLSSDSAVDEDDDAAALIDILESGKTLPTMKDTTVARNNSCLLPLPPPNWMSLPQLFSSNAVDVVDYDEDDALIDILAAGKTLPTTKDMTVEEHDGCPPLPDWTNFPELFSGDAVDVVDYDDAAAAVALLDILATGKTLPTMKNMTMAEHDSCLLSLIPTPPSPLPQAQFAGGDWSDDSCSWFASA